MIYKKMKHLKKYQDNNSKINEGFWDALFGRPTVDDAAQLNICPGVDIRLDLLEIYNIYN